MHLQQYLIIKSCISTIRYDNLKIFKFKLHLPSGILRVLHKNKQPKVGDEHYVVDLRSDTVSQPTDEMREAMRCAVVGDDVYNEDPTVKELQDRAAKLLGKEAGLFVPSGTMANLVAIMVHCTKRGSEIIMGDMSHTFRFEQAGAAQIAGVQIATVPNNPDGTFDLDKVQSKIRVNPDIHEPITSLIIVENTHNMCGGKVISMDWINELVQIGKKYNVPLHMDGARLFSAVVHSKISADVICKDFDSVCFCLSKNLGCPVGSILVGSKTFIQSAKRMRKALGGAMRQSGIIAAAGIVALDKMIDRLVDDHRHAYEIAKAIQDMNSKNFYVELDSVQTNIFMIYISSDKFTSKDVLIRLNTVKETDDVKVYVRALSRNPTFVRVTLYHDITDKDVELAIQKIKFVIKEFDENY